MATRMTLTIDPAGARSDARTATGQQIAMDADPPHGEGSAPSPKEALLAALGACTAIDVASILRKKQQRAATYEVVLTGESADSHPKVFTAIDVEHRVGGEVEPEALRRSIELSATRYCPVNAMLSSSVTITHRYGLERDGLPHAEAIVVVVGPAGRPAAAGA